MIKKVLLIASCLIIVFMSACSGTNNSQPSSPTSSPIKNPYILPTDHPLVPDEDAPIIELSQDTIKATVEQCKDKPKWGLGLGRVAIEYIAGATIRGAVVLHNGADAERFVTIEYRQPNGPQLDKRSGVTYQPAPIEASGWVSIDVDTLRMKKMETRVIDVEFTVPKGTKLPDKRWEFNVYASGYIINEYEQKIVVTTVENDTTLLVDLHHPLLQNSTDSMLSIESSLPEDNLRLVEYNPQTFELLIEGLAPSAERTIVLKYEYPGVVVTNYGQRWLITML